MLPDYYAILGVSRTANQLEIKAAYRNLAKLHHPDKHGGDPAKNRLFKEINEAYSVLSHTDTKFAYDKQLYWQEEQPQPGTTGYASAQAGYRPPPPGYRPPHQPYHYSPYQTYDDTRYVYSKWTLMYGKIFVTGLILFVVLLPIMLNYYFSNYFYNRGMEALENHAYYDAEYFFMDAMRDFGGSSTLAAIRVAEIKLALKKNYEALVYINLGLDYAEKTANKAYLYYLKGLAQRNLKQMHRADTSFRNALILHYTPDSVYTALAPLYAYELKNYPKAIACYDSLVRLQPRNYHNYLNRGFCRQKLDRHQAAIHDFDMFINNQGATGPVLFLKAISQLSLEQLDSACVNFRQAESLGINSAGTYVRLYCEIDTSDIYYPPPRAW